MFKVEIPPDAALAAPVSLGPARLALRSPAEIGGLVDGGWWPRSLDLSSELCPLLQAICEAGYAIHRVNYNLTGWDRPPTEIVVDGRSVRLGGSPSQHPSSIALIDTSDVNSSTVNRLTLVVIPPDTEAPVAERALKLAGRDGYRFRAKEILDHARHGRIG